MTEKKPRRHLRRILTRRWWTCPYAWRRSRDEHFNHYYRTTAGKGRHYTRSSHRDPLFHLDEKVAIGERDDGCIGVFCMLAGWLAGWPTGQILRGRGRTVGVLESPY